MQNQVEDIGDIDGHQWDMALESIPATSVSASHKLSQLFILHRAYRTPIQLHGWGRRDSPLCPKCKVHQGDFIHLLWRCPKLHWYWAEVSQCISRLAQVTVPLNPLAYLLGAIDEEMYLRGMYYMITRLLYLARKFIARYWMASTVLTRKQWITYVNSFLLREWLAYSCRKAARKFDLIWQPWLDDPNLAPPQLVMDRLLH